MLCAADIRLGAPAQMLALVARIGSLSTGQPLEPVPADAFAAATARCRWVILAGTYVEPPAECRWAVFCDDDFDSAVRDTIAHHFAVAAALGVAASHALGYSIAPYSHAYQRLHNALSMYWKGLHPAAPRPAQ